MLSCIRSYNILYYKILDKFDTINLTVWVWYIHTKDFFPPKIDIFTILKLMYMPDLNTVFLERNETLINEVITIEQL